jgi:hypothetical protein
MLNERDDDRSIGKSRHKASPLVQDAKIHPAQKRGGPGEIPAVASVRDQTLVWRVAASSSGSPARALHESLTGTSFAVAHFARMMPLLFLGHDWTANERAEIRRLEKFCEASDDWILECSHTDAGDPWCVVYDERHQRIVVHIARLERRLVVVMPRAQRVAYTTSMTAAVEMALNELRSHGPGTR